MPVNLEIDALADDSFDARVARVSPVVDPATGTFKITIEVSDSGRRLKPGMFARINIVSDKHANALQVPRNAIVEDAGETSIYVVNEDVAEKRPIRLGFAANGRVEVIDGLADSERVIVVGHTGLRNGSKVSIVNPADAGTDTAAGVTAAQNDDD
jgi:membrane fusion protein (multidrug efflux system)